MKGEVPPGITGVFVFAAWALTEAGMVVANRRPSIDAATQTPRMS